MKTYFRLILRKIVSAICELWDLALENVALRYQIYVLERSGRQPQFSNVPIEIFSKPIRSFRSLITQIAGAVKRRLTGLFRNLRSLPATCARRIVDEPVSCQSIHRLGHQTVIAPVGFAGRGPPIVKQLFNNLSSQKTPVAVLFPFPMGYTDTYCFRWRKVTQTIHLHHISQRSDRLAA
jgi:hypothetical protein